MSLVPIDDFYQYSVTRVDLHWNWSTFGQANFAVLEHRCKALKKTWLSFHDCLSSWLDGPLLSEFGHVTAIFSFYLFVNETWNSSAGHNHKVLIETGNSFRTVHKKKFFHGIFSPRDPRNISYKKFPWIAKASFHPLKILFFFLKTAKLLVTEEQASRPVFLHI